MRPTPLAADQRTTVSASRRPLRSCSRMPSTASGTSASSSSSALAATRDAASEPARSPAASSRKTSATRCSSLMPSFRRVTEASPSRALGAEMSGPMCASCGSSSSRWPSLNIAASDE
eukprot:scaffold67005_cov28-Tisochrysis_lutea.AAC.4